MKKGTRESFMAKSAEDVDFPLYGITPKEARKALRLLGYRRKSRHSSVDGLLFLQEKMRYDLSQWQEAIYTARYVSSDKETQS